MEAKQHIGMERSHAHAHRHVHVDYPARLERWRGVAER
jgi:hypothetical protein